MKKKLIPIVAVLAVAGGAYKFLLAGPAEKPKPPKVEGSVYVLGKEFLVNLNEGRFAKLTVALVLDPDDHSTMPAGGGHGAAPPKPPEGFGPMNQEAIVRDIVTDVLTDAKDHDLVDRAGRQHVKKEILERIHHDTDVHADDVLITDVTVQ